MYNKLTRYGIIIFSRNKMRQGKQKASHGHKKHATGHNTWLMAPFSEVSHNDDEQDCPKVMGGHYDSGPRAGQSIPGLQGNQDDVDETIDEESLRQEVHALPEHVPLDGVEYLQASK